MAGNLKDFATGMVLTAPSPDTSGTSIVLESGQGARMPATPFYAVAHPPAKVPTLDSAEKILVTAVSTDTLTIVRAQGDTTAQPIAVGWRISNAIFFKDLSPTRVSVSTAATTAAKVGTTADGDYTPELGDEIEVSFSSGSNVASPTLNIDGSGSKNIRLGNANVSTAFVGTTSPLILRMWYDGTYWQIPGSLKNDNTTYTEISSAEITAGTASTARAISGRRSEEIVTKARDGRVPSTDGTKLDGIEAGADVTDATNVDAAGAVMNSDTSTASMSFVVDEDSMASNSAVKVPTQQSVKAYVDAVGLWTAYTPTLTNLTLGNGSIVARYCKIGKKVSVYIMYKGGSTSSMGSVPTFSLPATASSGYAFGGDYTISPTNIGTGRITEGGSTQGYVDIRLQSSTSISPVLLTADATYVRALNISSSVPMSWSSSSSMFMQFTYEEA